MTDSTHYERGREAFFAGMTERENPHPSSAGWNAARLDWFLGWYDAWRLEKYGPNEDELACQDGELTDLSSMTLKN